MCQNVHPFIYDILLSMGNGIFNLWGTVIGLKLVIFIELDSPFEILFSLSSWYHVSARLVTFQVLFDCNSKDNTVRSC